MDEHAVSPRPGFSASGKARAPCHVGGGPFSSDLRSVMAVWRQNRAKAGNDAQAYLKAKAVERADRSLLEGLNGMPDRCEKGRVLSPVPRVAQRSPPNNTLPRANLHFFRGAAAADQHQQTHPLTDTHFALLCVVTLKRKLRYFRYLLNRRMSRGGPACSAVLMLVILYDVGEAWLSRAWRSVGQAQKSRWPWLSNLSGRVWQLKKKTALGSPERRVHFRGPARASRARQDASHSGSAARREGFGSGRVKHKQAACSTNTCCSESGADHGSTQLSHFVIHHHTSFPAQCAQRGLPSSATPTCGHNAAATSPIGPPGDDSVAFPIRSELSRSVQRLLARDLRSVPRLAQR